MKQNEQKPGHGDSAEDLELKIMANLSEYLARRIAQKGRRPGDLEEGDEEEDLPMSPFLVTPDDPKDKEKEKTKTDHNSKVVEKKPDAPRESMRTK